MNSTVAGESPASFVCHRGTGFAGPLEAPPWGEAASGRFGGLYIA
jgi:hypothetical protein